ncbi:hypothetical protein Pyn_16780 [Prunus yedoensis var. nudiflora]|uniref:Uncharacterized protein n=1 Tax=Prunus yedoensis var. nudiflora TaxID=2094558 RepID=A0A314Z8H6_PRUYE|nr:hypothetical protein Pyn_16780 [Prunus yedoensis var. nudiflora]
MWSGLVEQGSRKSYVSVEQGLQEALANPCRKRWSCRGSLLKSASVVNGQVTMAWISPRWRLLV